MCAIAYKEGNVPNESCYGFGTFPLFEGSGAVLKTTLPPTQKLPR
jgi:hypothetical protein